MSGPDPDIYTKIEELFGRGELHGTEASIDSLTGDVVVYSTELTAAQRQRVEEALGSVTYQPAIKHLRSPDAGRVVEELSETDLFVAAIPDRFRVRIHGAALSADRQTATLQIITSRSDPAAAGIVGRARVEGSELEVAVVKTELRMSGVVPSVAHHQEITVTLEQPFVGAAIRDIASGSRFDVGPLPLGGSAVRSP